MIDYKEVALLDHQQRVYRLYQLLETHRFQVKPRVEAAKAAWGL